MRGSLFPVLCIASFAYLLSVSLCIGSKIGAEYGSRPSGFIDVIKEAGGWTTSSGGAAVVDSSGWPTTDASILLFDNRAFPAWAPPIDDPQAIVPDDSGLYHFTFMGKATVGGYTFTLGTVTYNQTTGVTTGSFTVPAGINFVELSFTSSQRTPSSPTNTGITNLRVVRPGYALGDDLTKIFTDEIIQALSPFDHIRFMGWLGTNYDTTKYGAPLGGLVEWSTRRLPSDAHQTGDTLRAGTISVAWEYIILLANRINRDVWINIPVQASGNSTADTTSYIYNLALLFKNGNAFTGNKGLNSNLNIYFEHSNEVWNSAFSQYAWNKQQATNEVAAINSTLNWYFVRDQWGSANADTWAQRLHLRRVVEIGQIFASVFGAGSLNNRIRPIYAHFTVAPFQYQNALLWYSQVYNSPSQSVWGLAQTKYYDDGGAASNATIDQVVDAMNASSFNPTNVGYTTQIHTIAVTWGIQHTSYEGGAAVAAQNTVNIGNRILANRSPRMRQVVASDIFDNWFALGGNLYNYFASIGGYSRYGCWGATDLTTNLTTPKYLGLMDVISETSTSTSTSSSTTAKAATTSTTVKATITSSTSTTAKAATSTSTTSKASTSTASTGTSGKH